MLKGLAALYLAPFFSLKSHILYVNNCIIRYIKYYCLSVALLEESNVVRSCESKLNP